MEAFIPIHRTRVAFSVEITVNEGLGACVACCCRAQSECPCQGRPVSLPFCSDKPSLARGGWGRPIHLWPRGCGDHGREAECLNTGKDLQKTFLASHPPVRAQRAQRPGLCVLPGYVDGCSAQSFESLAHCLHPGPDPTECLALGPTARLASLPSPAQWLGCHLWEGDPERVRTPHPHRRGLPNPPAPPPPHVAQGGEVQGQGHGTASLSSSRAGFKPRNGLGAGGFFLVL